MLTKNELAELIHEYNLKCKNISPCRECFRIAGQILIAQGNRLVNEGIKRFQEDEKK